MALDFKSGAFLFVIILVSVYLAEMWAVKMIENQKKYDAYEASLQAAAVAAPQG